MIYNKFFKNFIFTHFTPKLTDFTLVPCRPYSTYENLELVVLFPEYQSLDKIQSKVFMHNQIELSQAAKYCLHVFLHLKVSKNICAYLLNLPKTPSTTLPLFHFLPSSLLEKSEKLPVVFNEASWVEICKRNITWLLQLLEAEISKSNRLCWMLCFDAKFESGCGCCYKSRSR